MSRVTLTKKANGRYYLGMDEPAYKSLIAVVALGSIPDRLGLIKAEFLKPTERLLAVLAKPARGEA